MKNNDLQNMDNYNKTIVENEIEIYTKYTNIVIQYLLLGIDKIKNHNYEYVKYILIKGLYTISYVFNILLKYTCNLELTYHHCQKSYSYYIEFIGQIGDDAVTYLQLNSKDAALFVYKKTIFDVPEVVKKKYTETVMNETKYKNVSSLIDIYNKLIVTEISQLKAEQLKNTEFINKMYTNVTRINCKLTKLYSTTCTNSMEAESEAEAETKKSNHEKCTTNNNEDFIKKMKYINAFCDIMILKKTSNNADVDEACLHYYKDYIKIIEYFIKKIRKVNLQKNFEIILTSKYFSEQFEEKIKLHSSLKFINWIFSNTNISASSGQFDLLYEK
jgi:hypothetical protein